MRNRSLTYSMIVSSALILAYLVAAILGRSLVLPEVIWQFIYVSIGTPWLAAGGGDAIAIIVRKFEASKQS